MAAWLLSALAVLSGCRKEQDFVIKGEPYFSADVIETVVDGSSETEVCVTTLTDNVWYELSQSGDAYSAATNANNHVRKAVRFKVSSNLRWKIVSAENEPAPWVHPFPDNGEKDGMFFFKAARNVSADTPREAFFNVLVDKGAGFEPLEGMIRVVQSESDDFLELSAAKYNASALEQSFRLRVLANVDWTYALEPMDDYGTPDVDWIEDRSTHEESKQIDTLNLRIGANESGVRGANLIISYTLSGRPATAVIPIVQYPAEEVDLPGFPVKWAVRVTPNTYDASWPANGTIAPVSGNGYIRYNNEAGKAVDTGGKCLLDVSDNSPRVTGPWPGDYCEFVAAAPVSAGTVIKICFATRVSKTGHKYWRLEYRDGEEWKPAGKLLTDEAVMGPDGQPVRYTHAMAADGSTNIKVENVVVYKNNTDQVEFRFICAANWQAGGAGALSAPNGGTWRLAVDTTDPSDEYQPAISCVAAGAEVLVTANLEVNASYLSFDGSKPASKTIMVTSDQPVTIGSDYSWIHAAPATLDAGENMPVTITVDESSLTTLREGVLTLKAGITRRDIPVIQGAAGQNLDPFISIVGKNSLTLEPGTGTCSIRLQSNVAVSASCDADWITVTPAPSSKGLVEYTDYVLSYTANDVMEARETLVRFFDAASGAQALLPVSQKGAEAEPTVMAKVGDVLWEEWFNGAAKDQKPSAYSASDAKTTVVFGEGTVLYSETGSTAIKDDGLVYYDKVANLTVEDYRYNVLVAKSNQSLGVTGIPCPGVKKARLTYRSNTKVDAHQVSSATSGVTVGALDSTQEVKLDMKDSDSPKYTNTITCIIEIAEGTSKLALSFTNTSANSNIRVDGFQLVVTEIW